MRAAACAAVVAIAMAADPAFAEVDRAASTFWKAVQARCDATAAKPVNEFGRRIAQTAITEFTRFRGHQIDSNGRLFHFGLTEAEHPGKVSGDRQAGIGHRGWWQVMNYWRAVFGNDFADKLEVRGYQDASISTDGAQAAPLLRTDAQRLLRAADSLSDPAAREILREAALRAAAIDTPWSAAFISYVVRQAEVPANTFRYANAHRVFIYDAFRTSAAELADVADARLYRACPLTATRPRPGDLICAQREPALSDASGKAVRERIRMDLNDNINARSIRRAHCEVVAYVDKPARKVYTVGGNVNQAVTVRKLNLRGDLKFSAAQKGRCGGAGHWTLPRSATGAPPKVKCSLNDKKWFVLLQLR